MGQSSHTVKNSFVFSFLQLRLTCFTGLVFPQCKKQFSFSVHCRELDRHALLGQSSHTVKSSSDFLYIAESWDPHALPGCRELGPTCSFGLVFHSSHTVKSSFVFSLHCREFVSSDRHSLLGQSSHTVKSSFVFSLHCRELGGTDMLYWDSLPTPLHYREFGLRTPCSTGLVNLHSKKVVSNNFCFFFTLQIVGNDMLYCTGSVIPLCCKQLPIFIVLLTVQSFGQTTFLIQSL